MKSLVFAAAIGLCIAGFAHADRTAARERAQAFVAAVEGKDPAELRKLRAEMLAGDDDLAKELGLLLTQDERPGVQNSVSAVLAEMKAGGATAALKSALFKVESEVRWHVAAALDRRGEAPPALTDAQRTVLLAAVTSELPIRAGIALKLLARDTGSTTADLVSPLLDRICAAPSTEAPVNRFTSLGPTASLVASAAEALRDRAADAVKAVQRYERAHADDWKLPAQSRRFSVVLRSLLGDTSDCDALLAIVGDDAAPTDVRLLAIRAVPAACGEKGRAALEALRPAQRGPAPPRSHASDHAAELGDAAAAALSVLNKPRGPVLPPK